MKRAIAITAAFLIASLLAGCGSTTNNNAKPVAVTPQTTPNVTMKRDAGVEKLPVPEANQDILLLMAGNTYSTPATTDASFEWSEDVPATSSVRSFKLTENAVAPWKDTGWIVVHRRIRVVADVDTKVTAVSFGLVALSDGKKDAQAAGLSLTAGKRDPSGDTPTTYRWYGDIDTGLAAGNWVLGAEAMIGGTGAGFAPNAFYIAHGNLDPYDSAQHLLTKVTP